MQATPLELVVGHAPSRYRGVGASRWAKPITRAGIRGPVVWPACRSLTAVRNGAYIGACQGDSMASQYRFLELPLDVEVSVKEVPQASISILRRLPSWTRQSKSTSTMLQLMVGFRQGPLMPRASLPLTGCDSMTWRLCSARRSGSLRSLWSSSQLPSRLHLVRVAARQLVVSTF